ncbi:MAG: LuxR C-terminal-related transcriptional regulator [Chloroflexia bacterium]
MELPCRRLVGTLERRYWWYTNCSARYRRQVKADRNCHTAAGNAQQLLTLLGPCAPVERPSGDRPETAELTRREREVLWLLAFGQNNRQIARQLCLSLRTVQRAHRQLYPKIIGAHNRAEATAFLRCTMAYVDPLGSAWGNPTLRQPAILAPPSAQNLRQHEACWATATRQSPSPTPIPRSSVASASRPRCAIPWRRRWPGAGRWC